MIFIFYAGDDLEQTMTGIGGSKYRNFAEIRIMIFDNSIGRKKIPGSPESGFAGSVPQHQTGFINGFTFIRKSADFDGFCFRYIFIIRTVPVYTQFPVEEIISPEEYAADSATADDNVARFVGRNIEFFQSEGFIITQDDGGTVFPVENRFRSPENFPEIMFEFLFRKLVGLKI